MRKIVLMLLSIAISWGANVNKLSPELRSKWNSIEPDEILKVYVFPKDQPPYEKLGSMFTEKRDIVQYLRDFAERTQTPILHELYNLEGVEEIRPFWVANVIRIKAKKYIVEALTELSEVGYIEEVPVTRIIRCSGTDSGGQPETPEWNIQKIMADSVWALGYTGAGIIVGNMDTGVDHDHPAFHGRWAGYWFDAVNGQSTPYDDNGHGTHTMGTILGGDGLGPDANDVGVAPGALFVAAKVFDSQGVGSNIMAGFQWYASLVGDSGVDVRIVNNSWGTSEPFSLAFWSSILTWRSLGIIPVFAIGNSGPANGTAEAPGNYPTVIGVGATDSGDNIASFSSRGPSPDQSPWNDPQYWCDSTWNLLKPDISAPGVNIRSSIPGGSYQGGWFWQGTSMAAPHVTGVIALMLERNVTLDFCEVLDILISSADHPAQGGSYPNYDYGYGRVNALNAVLATPELCTPLIVFVGYSISAGGDEIIDPGDTVLLYTTFTNLAESTAYGMYATMEVTPPYVVPIVDSVYFGDVMLGDTVTNSEEPFVFFVPSSAGIGDEIQVTLHVVSNGGSYTQDYTLSLFVGLERYDYLSVIAGNALLTVTDKGAIGFMSSQQLHGQGFIYPYPAGSNLLYYGSFAAGNAPDYVVDAWYETNGMDDNDWLPTTNPDGRLINLPDPPRLASQAVIGYFDDSGHPTPKGLVASQLAFCYDHPDYDDFVLVEYWVKNSGSSTLNDLYIAYFMDFDIMDYSHNEAAVDTADNLAYIWFVNNYGGVALVEGTLANLSIVRNDSFVYPYEGMPDSIQYQFMNGGYSFHNDFGPLDYSVVVSAGPYTLNPGDSVKVAFAVVGGTSESEIITNAQNAYAVYHDSTLVSVTETWNSSPKMYALRLFPNPVSDIGRIVFSLPRKDYVDLSLYDVSGRRVRNLFNGNVEPGIYSLKFKAGELREGVYFLRIKTSSTDKTVKAIVIH